MSESDIPVTDRCSFHVPIWTVAHISLKSGIRIAGIPTANNTQGEAALGLFTDTNKADCYRSIRKADGETFHVFVIDDSQKLELWLTIAEKVGLTHVAFDYTQDATAEGWRCSAVFETLAEARRLANTMRLIQ